MSGRLSVCLTTYNRGHILDRTLRSLAAQSRLPDELIVSDDCSTDNTVDIVAEWIGTFPQLRYYRNPRNLYQPGNLNAALAKTTGDYVIYVQDGDVYHHTLLEKAERALDEYPSAGFVFFGLKGFPYRSRYGWGVSLHEIDPLTPGRVFFERFLLRPLFLPVWGTVMMRRSSLDELLPFDESFPWIADVDMFMRFCLRNDVAYIREPLVTVDNSDTHERGFSWEHQEILHRIRIANIERFFGDDPVRLRRELRRQQRIWKSLRAMQTIGGSALTRLLRSDPIKGAFWWSYSQVGATQRRRRG